MKKQYPVRVISVTADFKDGQTYVYDFVISKHNRYFTTRKPDLILDKVQHISINFKVSEL